MTLKEIKEIKEFLEQDNYDYLKFYLEEKELLKEETKMEKKLEKRNEEKKKEKELKEAKEMLGNKLDELINFYNSIGTYSLAEYIDGFGKKTTLANFDKFYMEYYKNYKITG